MSDASPFSHDVRLLLCGNCAGPLPAPNEGGVATCKYCDAKSVLTPREEVPIRAPDKEPMSEEVRLLFLREQDGKNLMPPGDMPFALMVWHGENDSKRSEMGLERWKEALAAIKKGGPDSDSHEQVISWLTLTFVNYYSSRKEWDQLRGMLETSVEVCQLPSNQQILRCYLARFAARTGDFQAAEEWLAPCDPRSDDLRMDSAWRFTTAIIAQYRGDFPKVLEVLGRSFDALPITQELDYTVSMVRANALERTGDLESAKQVLRDTMASVHGPPRVLLEIAKQSHTELCPQAWPPIYASAQRRWVFRYYMMLLVSLGAVSYLALGWIFGEAGDGWSIRYGWLLFPILPVAWVLKLRWRP